MSNDANWPVSDRRIRRSRPANLHLRLLGDLQPVVDLDPEIPDGALQFRMSDVPADPGGRCAG